MERDSPEVILDVCVCVCVCRELSRKHVDEGKGRFMQSRKVGDIGCCIVIVGYCRRDMESSRNIGGF